MKKLIYAATTVIILFILLFNTFFPYHTDSAIYSLNAKKLHISQWRPGLDMIYLIFSLVAGYKYAHLLFTILSIILTIFSLWKFYGKIDGRVLLILLMPSTIFSLLIGKDDPFVFSLLVLSIYFFRNKRILLSSLLYGFAILSKETSLIMLPFFLLEGYFNKIDIKKFTLFLFTTALISSPMLLYVVNQLQKGYEHIGKFYGFFSPYQYILSKVLIKGLGIPGILLFFITVYNLWKNRSLRNLAYMSMYVLSFLYLSNVSTTGFRTILFAVPYLLPLLNGSKKIDLLALLLTPILLLGYLPNMEIKHLNLPAKYPIKLSKEVNFDIVLGMDNCALVEYYIGKDCITHPAFCCSDNDPKTFVKELYNRIKNKNIVVYPDWFSYDRNKEFMKTFLQCFDIVPIFEDWYEDYHHIKIYGGLESLKEKFFIPDNCQLLPHITGFVEIEGLKFNAVNIVSDCGFSLKVLEREGVYAYGIYKAKSFYALPKDSCNIT